jgi:hypothetical protein
VGRLGGPRGPPRRGPCPVCALKQDAFGFGFLQVLSGISPVVLGDPQGCPRQRGSLSTARGAARTGRAPGAPAALWSVAELFFSQSTRL